MRLSTRLIRNATTSYIRLGASFVIGVFITWYAIGEVGVIGFGLMALAVSSSGPSVGVERALRFGLVRALAVAVASGRPRALRRSLASAFRLCAETALPLTALVLGLAGLAWAGMFNTPDDQPELKLALALLILGEGIHTGVRLLTAPYLQSLFAAQLIGLDNLLFVLSRVTYAVSLVLVFGWLLAGESLAIRLIGFAITRATVQLADVVLGIWLAKSHLPGLRLDRSAYDDTEYRAMRSTVWHTSHVTLLLNLNPQLLAILINLFFGLTFNTLWQLAVQFSGWARMATEGLLRGAAPLATHLQQSGRVRAVVDLMGHSVRYQLALALPLAALMGVYIYPLLDLWVGGRLAADPHLAAAGITPTAALGLTATMALVLLLNQTLRAGLFGIESVLYGIGKVHSYAWSAKWATIATLGSAWALMSWYQQPEMAAVALLVCHSLFLPVVVLRAARIETGLPIGTTLRRSVPRPLIATLTLLALLVPARLFLPRLTLAGLGALLIGSALVYGSLALLLILDPDERSRLRQLLGDAVEWLMRGLRARSGSGG